MVALNNTKSLALTSITSVTATSSIFLISSGSLNLSENQNDLNLSPLSEDVVDNLPVAPKTLTNYRTRNYIGNYAYYFGKLFIDTTSNDDKWWDNAFSRLLQEKKEKPNNLSDEFEKIEEAFNGNNQNRSLNKLCEKFHQSTYSKMNVPKGKNPSFTVRNFWKFCTVVEEELELVNVSTKGEAIVKEKHRTVLVAAEEDKNNKFWEAQEEAFFEDSGLGLSSISGSSFHSLYQNRNSQDRDTLKNTCLKAYDKKVEEDNEIEINDTLTFCSISITAQ